MKQSTIRIPDEMLDLVGIKRNANESTDEEDTKAIIGILHSMDNKNDKGLAKHRYID